MRKYINRVDDNQLEIVKIYESMGCSVAMISALPGLADILVGICGVTDIVEIKDGRKPPSRRKLTPDEQKFHDRWKGGPVQIVTCVDDVVSHVQDMMSRAK